MHRQKEWWTNGHNWSRKIEKKSLEIHFILDDQKVAAQADDLPHPNQRWWWRWGTVIDMSHNHVQSLHTFVFMLLIKTSSSSWWSNIKQVTWLINSLPVHSHMSWNYFLNICLNLKNMLSLGFLFFSSFHSMKLKNIRLNQVDYWNCSINKN